MERREPNGTRARVSYAWQETTDWWADSRDGIGQHLAKVTFDLPVLPQRLSTAFELQRLDVVGSAFDPDRPFVVSNFGIATTGMNAATHVSFSARNLFNANAVRNSGRLMSAVPTDGRSVRFDLTRKL